MNSEGTAFRYDDRRAVSLYATVEGQAPDGMVVHDFAATFQAFEPEKLPSGSRTCSKGFTAVAENMRALVHGTRGRSVLRSDVV
jgi:hypothetical protein